MRGGVDMVQLRMKRADDESIIRTARRFVAVCGTHGVLTILNDRPDLVEAAGVDGVHVGQDDVPTALARETVGSERLVGLSTHSLEQIDAAAGADYIGVGPIHETPTKPGRPAVGLELIRYAAHHAGLPFFAIGGIGVQNIVAVRHAGARRAAVVRALTESGDPEQTARSLKAALRASGREEAQVGSA